MTLNDLIADVWRRCRQEGMALPEPDEVEAWEAAARKRAARNAIKTEYRPLLETTIAPALTSNFASLASNTDALIESVEEIDDITHTSVAAGAQRFMKKKTRRELDYLKSGTVFAYYHVGKDGIYVKYPAGTLADASTLTVRIVLVPSLASWPDVITDRLIDALVEIYREKQAALPPQSVGTGEIKTDGMMGA